jgi:hypothetical protein
MYLDTVPAAMPEANRLYESTGFIRVERYNKNPVADLDLPPTHHELTSKKPLQKTQPPCKTALSTIACI